jgi:hypothetical protein
LEPHAEAEIVQGVAGRTGTQLEVNKEDDGVQGDRRRGTDRHNPRVAHVTAGSAATDAVRALPDYEPSVHRNDVEALWNAQAEDAHWTETVRDDLATSFADLKTQAKVLDVSCRTTFCRIMLEFVDPMEAVRYSQEIGAEDTRQWVNVVRGPGSSFAVEVFFGRQDEGR